MASPKQKQQLVIREHIAHLYRAAELEDVVERAAQLLDWVTIYHWLLPHNAEFDRLLLEHTKWVEKQRNAGKLAPAKTIKRPVSKPKARKSLLDDDRVPVPPPHKTARLHKGVVVSSLSIGPERLHKGFRVRPGDLDPDHPGRKPRKRK